MSKALINPNGLGLFLAWVWLYLLEKPLQNFVKYFFFLFFWLWKIR